MVYVVHSDYNSNWEIGQWFPKSVMRSKTTPSNSLKLFYVHIFSCFALKKLFCLLKQSKTSAGKKKYIRHHYILAFVPKGSFYALNK